MTSLAAADSPTTGGKPPTWLPRTAKADKQPGLYYSSARLDQVIRVIERKLKRSHVSFKRLPTRQFGQVFLSRVQITDHSSVWGIIQVYRARGSTYIFGVAKAMLDPSASNSLKAQ